MSALRQFALPLALFSILWVDLCRQLSYTWDTNEQYAYGWFVPLLALGLFIRRWPTRPSVVSGPVVSGPVVSGPVVSGPVVSGPVVSGLIIVLCAALLPLRVIIEINPDWPLITWAYTLIVVALTLYALHLADPRSSPREMSGPAISPGSAFRRFISAFNFLNFSFSPRPPSSVVGGPSPEPPNPISAFCFHNFRFFRLSPWVAHFAFPICFILVAVQWPYRIEKGLTQNLMQIVASLTVEIIGWFGIPAIQQGNLIELSTGVLGVDEACSGIRSFQSTLMAALFLGELYLLRVPIRLLLVVAGLGAAFLLNVCRTLILTWQANAHGLSAIDKWHDPAGFTIAIACFGVLWLLAILIKRKCSPSATQTMDHGLRTTDSNPPSSAPETVDSGLRTPDSGPGIPGPNSAFPISAFCFQPLRRYLLAVGCWSLLCLLATEVWYRSHEIKDVGIFHWSVALPESKPRFKKTELPPRSLKLLAFDFGATGQWSENDGSEWTLYFFRWNPNSVQSIIQSRNHRPDVCLPASGLRPVSESQLEFFQAGDLKLPFRSYVYEAQGRTLYVFFCQWEDGAEHQTGLEASKQAGRLQSVLTGRRLLGQQTLEVILSGCNSLESAKDKLRQELPMLVNRSGAGQLP